MEDGPWKMGMVALKLSASLVLIAAGGNREGCHFRAIYLVG